MNKPVAEIALRQNSSCGQSKERLQPQTFRPTEPYRVYMSFVRLSDGWHCRFHQDDLLKSPISRRFVFRRAEKIHEAAQRGNGLIDEESCQSLDGPVALGRGGIWLRLTEGQYSALVAPRPLGRAQTRKTNVRSRRMHDAGHDRRARRCLSSRGRNNSR
jgi:hypothetical protein